MPTAVYRRILLFLLIGIGLFGIWRTIPIQKYGGSGDMRNRVVGARLVKDGIVPYYYHWFPGDSLKYVMELDVDTVRYRKASSITSSPVFHRLLGPVSHYDEPIIDKGFFLFFYALLLVMIVMAAHESKYLLLAVAFFVPFLFSDGWGFHILMGQVYFLFGMLLFLISWGLLKKQYLFAGLLFALLVLLRLNSVVFLLPFLLLFRKYKVFIGGALVGWMVYALVLVASPFERQNWNEYFEAVHEYTDMHLNALSPKANAIPAGPFPEQTDALLPAVLEGQHFAEMRAARAATPQTNIFYEPSNFFLVYKFLLKRPPTSLILNGLLVLAYGIVFSLLLVCRKKRWHNQFPLEPLLFTGLLFYQLSCFLSPINTFPYQMPQWMAVAAFIVIFHKKIPVVLIGVFLLGIVENSIYFPDIIGKHVLTELIFIVATLSIIIWGKWGRKVEINPIL